ncbi:polar amino acid transport system substrate-binding protein [Frankia sp. AiPs1]|uniref:glutamate ABC transporter substrate-binding protein n=1 Tax=Frankia sp. AiPa1 TaxID=573492 RepID=UPI00202B1737|nr:glutamate ABC transporter substrate-binding protein [Frankia sp. AiPa1]MCL9759971.1 glutamate ABC transporter substrate-binding protein [Frankia sp. AiPa1]
MRRVLVVVLAAAVAAAVVTGCSTVSSRLPAQARPLSLPASSSAAPPTSAAPVAGCTDPRASWRPAATQPTPGAMPSGSFMARIVRRGYLRVGVLGDSPPFGSINVLSGQAEGFDVDIADEIGRALFGSDGHVRLRTITNAERINVVRDDAVDLVVATMSVTCQRRTQVDFSSVYYDARQRLLVQAGSGITSLADLDGKKVCAAVGTTTIARIAQGEGTAHPQPYPVTNVADCLVALQQGRVEAASNDDTVLAGMVAQDPHLRIVGPSLEEEPDAIAISLAHPDFTRFVNGVLARIFADGTWAQIYRHRLGELGAVPAPPTPRYRD